MKKILIYALSLSPFFVKAQEVESFVENGKAYIIQPANGNATLEELAARHGATVNELLQLNGLKDVTSVTLGQQLKLPIGNVIKADCKGGDCVKVYYAVQAHEGLYRIGVNHGNIKMPQLRQLNNLKADAVSIGQKIQVGYLPFNPAVAGSGAAPVAATAAVPAQPIQAAKPVVAAPVEQKKPAEVKPEPVAAKPVEKAPVQQPAQQPQQPATITQTKATTPAPVATTVVNTTPAVNDKAVRTLDIVDGNTLTYKGNGFFENLYKEGKSQQTITVSTFKSSSGWADGKFYVLMSGVEIGSTVKLINPGNNSFVYAKVLSELPAIKQNESIQARLSNAAATALGFSTDHNFQVQVQ